MAQLQGWAASALPARTWSVRGLVATLLDPERPEARALLVFAVVLIAAAWTFFGIVEDVLTRDPLVVIDKTVYRLLQGLRTPFGDSVMIALTQLGDTAVTLPVMTAVLLWLLWKRAWRPAAYWLAAASFGAVLTLRLWPSEMVLQGPRRPLWVGMVMQETIRHPLAWFNLPEDGHNFIAPRQILLESLSDWPVRVVSRSEVPEPASAKIVWDHAVLLSHEPE